MSKLAALLVLLTATHAIAQDRARGADEAFDFALAERLYREQIAAAPDAASSAHSRARLDWLAARRDRDGGYDELAILERARREGVDARGLHALERALRAMTPGLVRRETLFFLGETYFRRLDSPERALPYYRALLGTDAREEAAGALAEAHDAIARKSRRLTAAILGALSVLAALVIARVDRVRRITSPPRALIAAAAIATLGPTAIATIYDPSVTTTFVALALVSLAMLVIATLVAAAANDERRRLATACLLAAAHLACAYLALDWGGGLP